ncbi:MAG: glycosyltransferase [Rhodospirillales bacterium]|nr:glycosyltransferase [Rhodospirillales bacterium]
MKLCDITIAYNESSGGIRTYIDEKRRYLREQTRHDHLLIVPGVEDAVERGERSTVVSLAGPLLPGQDSYRFFARPGRIRAVLLEHRPDVVELGSYYLSPWAAFSYRQRLRAAGHGCVIGCYFHTDVAEAYVAAPLRGLVHGLFEDWSETLSGAGNRIVALLAGGTERYVGAVFAASDIVFAPSPAQAERLRGYGVDAGAIVPLGVDLDLFHPSRRSEAIRARHGTGPDTIALVYAGRLSNEKRVSVLIEALARLPSSFAACLWITGHGPLLGEVAAAAAANPALRLLPYQRSREHFAALLASADIYVTAGPHETFALSVIEAQAAGLPAVAVDAGALRDRVPEGLGYLGPVDDPAAMAENIIRAASARRELAARARAHVEARFGWDSTFRTLLSCYERTLATLDLPLPSAGA